MVLGIITKIGFPKRQCGHTCNPRVLLFFGNSYRIERSFNNHLPRGNTQVTINPKQPSKTTIIFQDQHSKTINGALWHSGYPNKNLETSSKNSPPPEKKIIQNHPIPQMENLPSQQVQDTLSFSISRSFFCKALTLRRKASASPGSTGGRRRNVPAWLMTTNS